MSISHSGIRLTTVQRYTNLAGTAVGPGIDNLYGVPAQLFIGDGFFLLALACCQRCPGGPSVLLHCATVNTKLNISRIGRLTGRREPEEIAIHRGNVVGHGYLRQATGAHRIIPTESSIGYIRSRREFKHRVPVEINDLCSAIGKSVGIVCYARFRIITLKVLVYQGVFKKIILLLGIAAAVDTDAVRAGVAVAKGVTLGLAAVDAVLGFGAGGLRPVVLTMGLTNRANAV